MSDALLYETLRERRRLRVRPAAGYAYAQNSIPEIAIIQRIQG
ncbi:MAG: hypothetical protein ACYT04_67725 [Nostoc sp.]